MSGSENPFQQTSGYAVVVCSIIFLLLGAFLYLVIAPVEKADNAAMKLAQGVSVVSAPEIWAAPDSNSIPSNEEGQLIRYGRELISHTARYLGPRGEVASMSNGMNCQNCHLQSGTKPFGNNYALVASSYPRFRARSGSIESVEKRINDCLERSLNGIKLSLTSREMLAMKAYILWVGQEVEKNKTPTGAGLGELPLMSRAADPIKGKQAFDFHCVRCHGPQGRGRRMVGDNEWIYPPLVGDSSYSSAAGLYRLSRFAAYVKYNMPDGTTFEKPVLTDEEAWDVAAYINSLPRPSRDISMDWPDISNKPFDHPFGPYADTFSEEQHKFGPFIPIALAKKRK
jgi:thiosulfate dehydrogenase